MQNSVYRSYDDLPLFLNAEMVAKWNLKPPASSILSYLCYLRTHSKKFLHLVWIISQRNCIYAWI